MWKRLRNLSKDTVATLWLSFGIFISLSLYSYSPLDPSLNSLGAGGRPLNWCGYLGSFLADGLFQFFGLSSWIVTFFIIVLGLQTLFFGSKKLRHRRSLWLLLLLFIVATLSELYDPNISYYSGIVSIGGSIGAFFAHQLVRGLNFYGAAIFLWATACISILAVTDWTLSGIVSHLVRSVSWVTSSIWSNRPEFHIPSFSLKSWLPTRNTPITVRTSQAALPTIFSNNPDPFLEDDVESDGDEETDSRSAAGPVKKRKVKLTKKVERKVENWKLPALSILEDPPAARYRVDEKEVQKKSKLLVDKLSQFSVTGVVKGAKPGPAVTLFEFKPRADVKISKITELADDLSLALSSESVRIIAPIPGRDVVGIETSNAKRETVYLKDILANDDFWDSEVSLPLALGREANGTPKVVDLRRMPHLLVAGTTGSGKSVFVVCALTGLLFRHSPATLRLILIDPKQVDLSTFNDIPHLLMPTICEPKKAVLALKWAVKEMEKRYRSMSKFGSRGLEAFNETVAKLDKEQLSEHEAYNQLLEEQKRVNEAYYFTPQPYIVIVVEEFGDLMTVDKTNVEQLVVRLAQMARASGIHLILAMQSPRKDVVTGMIKTNIPGRISFKVASKMDSRIILDESGGERLLARGDMLFLSPGVSKPIRHHGPWVTEEEISSVMEYWSDQGTPEYDDSALKSMQRSGGQGQAGLDGDFGDEDEEYDERYDEIVSWASSVKEISASYIQRKFRIGYPRAARLIEVMEREGVVGPSNGSKPRQVLVQSYDKSP